MEPVALVNKNQLILLIFIQSMKKKEHRHCSLAGSKPVSEVVAILGLKKIKDNIIAVKICSAKPQLSTKKQQST